MKTTMDPVYDVTLTMTLEEAKLVRGACEAHALTKVQSIGQKYQEDDMMNAQDAGLLLGVEHRLALLEDEIAEADDDKA